MFTLNTFEALHSAHDWIVRKEISFNGSNFVKFGTVYSSDTHFNDLALRQCRGITFNKETGELVSLPFPKFFNINETEENRLYKLKKEKIVRTMDKLDGSMIHTFIVNDTICCCTKMGNDNAQSIASSKIIHSSSYDYKALIHEASAQSITPLFEYTSPNNQVVIPYKTDALTLIGLRCMRTGKMLSLDHFKHFDIPIVDSHEEYTTESLLQKVLRERLSEGYVALYETGELVKFKTPWYTNNHKVLTLFRLRDVAKAHLEGSSDDIIAILRTLNEYEKLEAYERAIKVVEKKVHDLNLEVNTLSEKIVLCTSSRDAYELYGKDPLFKAAKLNLNGSFDARDHVKDKMIKHFNLDPVDNT